MPTLVERDAVGRYVAARDSCPVVFIAECAVTLALAMSIKDRVGHSGSFVHLVGTDAQ